MPLKSCARTGCRLLVPVGTAHCPAHARDAAEQRWTTADAARSEDLWRRWYKLKRWSQLRRSVLDRDGWRCQWPGCGCLLRDGRADPRAAVVDHILPHRGDAILFWSGGNLQSLCKTHHDIHKARAESTGHQSSRYQPRNAR